MKKSLFAVAALSAIAGAAQAQSSVTVYGIVDVGFIGINERATAGATTTKGTVNTFGSSAEQSSRLGFKGTEDLGGGSSAFFTLETGLNADNSTLSAFNTRQAFAGYKKNGIGNVAFGTQYTPIHNAAGLTDPGQLNNMIGNVIFATTPQANGNTSPFATNPSIGSGQTDAYTVRTSNTLTATTDTFAGFQGTALYTLNNQNQTVTATSAGGTTNNSGWGLGLNYTWNKLLVTANYQAFKSLSPTSSATTVTLYGITGGTNVNDQQSYFAATYDFGILKAYAQYVSRKATAALNSGYYAKRTAEQIGVRSFITPTIEAWASGGMGKVNAYGQGEPNTSFTAWQLGSNYWLSKRTNLYAIYGQSQASNVTSVAGTQYSYGGSNYAIGLRHTF
ncbi:hypothetical protein A8O14_00640 [Polynucleobacter wuianus]|uniref:Porin domain-containing protein n=1 Tax=Polynucleobacter wuianus TaxID=1743168 RepID=A0A191UCW3_9BURK|nr:MULTISPECIES: porin [Polynucleobacter]ANI98735.1 hypothetical protein A8O14_00640 [Polynucleobacter wuianus]MBU3553298.1 porin [Polynucleobacter sp. MWH-Post4-6-1]